MIFNYRKTSSKFKKKLFNNSLLKMRNKNLMINNSNVYNIKKISNSFVKKKKTYLIIYLLICLMK